MTLSMIAVHLKENMNTLLTVKVISIFLVPSN